MTSHPYNLPKSERLCSHYLIDRLFEPGKGSKSLSSYPLRIVYRPISASEHGTSILVSVPKKQFKHAVDRNHVKRQIREAYRLNKDLLRTPEGISLNIAFIWLDNRHYPSAIVTNKVKNLLQRITESCEKS